MADSPRDHLVVLTIGGDTDAANYPLLDCEGCDWQHQLTSDTPPSEAAALAARHVAEATEQSSHHYDGPTPSPAQRANGVPDRVQVGWLGQTGGMYAWWEDPMGDGREPGGISPVYADRGD